MTTFKILSVQYRSKWRRIFQSFSSKLGSPVFVGSICFQILMLSFWLLQNRTFPLYIYCSNWCLNFCSIVCLPILSEIYRHCLPNLTRVAGKTLQTNPGSSSEKLKRYSQASVGSKREKLSSRSSVRPSSTVFPHTDLPAGEENIILIRMMPFEGGRGGGGKEGVME